ncbi:endoglucanase [Streptomyces sp. 604F]|uniref:glycoside hydrolase family 6 protein n=1 Tax=Streptomyces sp. 604F TaxID=1476754 RepID=UPI0013993227|nr:glycoside hydrolase family 6 protein [Streptomyces sp. 604F]MBP3077199.1 endoglucanase [Streptomyces sp. 604F]QHV87613.1 endoglucanase [Streptomyces sp. 604F]
MSRLMPVPARSTRPFLTLGLLALLAAAPACTGDDSARDAREAEPSRSAAAAVAAPEFWVDPESPAAVEAARLRVEGKESQAALLERIARQPAAVWPAGDDPVPAVRRATGGAAKAGSTAVLVAYNVPHRDCGQHSAGGAADRAAYGEWIDAFASAIGRSEAVVVLEPDAVPHIVDGCTPAEYHGERSALISGAIERLKRQPGVKVYLDAGNPAWIEDPEKIAGPLRRAGIDRADGFSLNVSNFQTDTATRAYGKALSERLDGAHYVVDTSRNGNGPLGAAGQDAWCNPPGRALGTPPTTRTGDPLLDAYLWIKRPGESDGSCRGGPSAGTWWPEYALRLARNTKG